MKNSDARHLEYNITEYFAVYYEHFVLFSGKGLKKTRIFL